MAGLPNSSNALQQWHHLFEAQGGPRTPEASQHLQQLLPDCRRANTRTGNTLRWMPYLTVALSPMRSLSQC